MWRQLQLIKPIVMSKNTTCVLSAIVNLALSANRTTVSESKLYKKNNFVLAILNDTKTTMHTT